MKGQFILSLILADVNLVNFFWIYMNQTQKANTGLSQLVSICT